MTEETENRSQEDVFMESLSRAIPNAKDRELFTPSESSKRSSPKQRKASMEEYKQTFLSVPKIVDRQTVFICRETRDKVDVIVRRLGERKMSVSGFVENVISKHLEMYADDIELWKKL